MARGRIAKHLMALVSTCALSLSLSLSLSLVVSSDAAALALPRSDLSGLSTGAKSVLASLFSGGHSIGETYSDFDDIPPEAQSEEEDLGELGVPTAPVFEGPRGYVEGQSRELGDIVKCCG